MSTVVRVICVGLTALLFLTASMAGHAFSVSPIHIEMTTLGREARGSITAVNHRGTRIGVDVSIVQVSLSDTGELVELGSGEDDFLIFPPQTYIEPYGSQVFRLQWVADPEIDSSKSYLISVREVPGAAPPAKDGQTQASVSLALAFAVIVNVRPIEGIPNISVDSVRAVKSEENVGSSGANPVIIPRIAANFHNNSNVHGVLSRSQLIVTLTDKTGIQLLRRRLRSEEIERNIGIGLLPPRQTRTLSIPLEGVDPELVQRSSSITVTVELDDY